MPRTRRGHRATQLSVHLVKVSVPDRDVPASAYFRNPHLTSTIEVLRRPVESGLRAVVGVNNTAGFGSTVLDRHVEGVDDKI
jgi:hypothetical protein